MIAFAFMSLWRTAELSIEDIASLATQDIEGAEVKVLAEGACAIRILRTPKPGGRCVAGSEPAVTNTLVVFSEVREIDAAQIDSDHYLIFRFNEEVTSHYRALKNELNNTLSNRENRDVVRTTIENWSSAKIAELSSMDIGTSEKIKQCNGKTRLGILSHGFAILEVSEELSMIKDLAVRRLLSSCQRH